MIVEQRLQLQNYHAWVNRTNELVGCIAFDMMEGDLPD